MKCSDDGKIISKSLRVWKNSNIFARRIVALCLPLCYMHALATRMYINWNTEQNNMLYIDMKKNVLSIIALVLVLLLGSCGSSKKVAYFQNIDTLSLATSRGLYDAKLMPKDILTITVNTTDPQVSLPFTLFVQPPRTASGQVASGSGSLQQYLVDNDGNIQFPVVGRIHVGGLTKTQCED